MTQPRGRATRRPHAAWLLVGLVLLAGCAAPQPPLEPAMYDISDFIDPDTPRPLEVHDPIESVNRDLYQFNYYFDTYLFIPTVNAYRFVLPHFARRRISDFFYNIAEIPTFINAALQLKPAPAGITLTRFVVNSTVGLLGFWDPATIWMGLQRQDEDLGQTLGHYGVGDGPYLVLPVFGPSNARDGVGLMGDTAAFRVIDPLNFKRNPDLEIPYFLIYAVVSRARQSFRYYQSGSPFEYEFVRMIYTEKRKLQIAK